MEFISAVHSEMIKVKHTSFWAIHAIIPILGALIFILYFMIYQDLNEYRKFKLILELIALVFPLLISVIVGINITQEERASYFQAILAVPNRSKLFGAKLVMLYVAGILALAILLGLFIFGSSILKLVSPLSIIVLMQAAIGLALGNLIVYMWHLFLSLKFGLGISIFCGVFESLQCILYSNIKLQGIWRYIPFAWSMDWIQDILNDRLLDRMVEWTIIVVLMTCFSLVIIRWFYYWEGRKNYE